MVVEMNSGFDEIAHTQAGMPHLVQLLWDRYLEHLAKEIETRKEKGLGAVPLPEAIRRAPATHFVEFAANYLKRNRVVENFFVDENHGLRLSDNTTCVVCPGTNVQGTMQDAGEVGVTRGESQPGNEGVIQIQGTQRV
jgi:hypothetical protein